MGDSLPISMFQDARLTSTGGHTVGGHVWAAHGFEAVVSIVGTHVALQSLDCEPGGMGRQGVREQEEIFILPGNPYPSAVSSQPPTPTGHQIRTAKRQENSGQPALFLPSCPRVRFQLGPTSLCPPYPQASPSEPLGTL